MQSKGRDRKGRIKRGFKLTRGGRVVKKPAARRTARTKKKSGVLGFFGK